MKSDFLHITDYSRDEFWEFIERSSWVKKKIKDDSSYKPFAHKTLAMIFAKVVFPAPERPVIQIIMFFVPWQQNLYF